MLKELIPQNLFLDLRQYPIIRRYKAIAKACRRDIEEQISLGNGQIKAVGLQPKQKLVTDKIIWQYWGQGVEDMSALPEVVQACFKSVDRYKGDYQVIRLSDETIKDYLDFPDFVYDKLANNPAFTRTFFSDLLRLALLATYGGVWLDATILLTAPLPKAYTSLDFFAFQRSEDVSNEERLYWRSSYYAYWGWKKGFKVRLLNSIIFARTESKLLQALFTLIYNYWQKNDSIQDYFFFQIYFQELVEQEYKDYNPMIVSDTLPHILHTNISTDGRYSFMTEEQVLKQCSIHKMSYFKDKDLERFLALVNRLN